MQDDGPLADEPFAFTATKNGLVIISFHGRSVLTLHGRQAVQFCGKVEGRDAHQQQLVMAKVTGQFKMGNEKANVPKH